VPLPPGRMPLRRDGQLRKRWRYIAVLDDELMLCAARAEVGPLAQSFWTAWDRTGRERHAHTSFRPGSREVTMDGPDIEIAARALHATLRFGESAAVEAICPSGSGWGWTRKRAGMPVTGSVEVGGRRWELNGRGVDDESAGYHQRRTSWHWSAGVGRTTEGAAVAWNLVEGINDPQTSSERAIWIDGSPSEPPPVSFRGLDAIEFEDGSALGFAPECERARSDNLLVLRSRYRLRFGTFSGSLAGVQIAAGLGVMEAHDARW